MPNNDQIINNNNDNNIINNNNNNNSNNAKNSGKKMKDNFDRKMRSIQKFEAFSQLQGKTAVNNLEDEENIRKVAYDNASKNISKWQSIVDDYDNADHLHFPLVSSDNSLKMIDFSNSIKKLNRKNQKNTKKSSLQLKTEELLGNDFQLASPDIFKKTLKSSKSHDDYRNSLRNHINEVRKYQSEVLKFKTMIASEQLKNRLHRNIKSKRFRKLKRSKLLKEQVHSEESFNEIQQKSDINRARERMSMKHVGKSRSMQRKLLYGKYDASIRNQVEEMRSKGRELLDTKLSSDRLLSLSSNFRDNINDLMSNISNNNNNNDINNNAQYDNDYYLEEENEDLLNIDKQENSEDLLQSNPWLNSHSKNNSDNDNKTNNNTTENCNNITDTINNGLNIYNNNNNSIRIKQRNSQNSLNVAQAFASDDVIAHFEEEKAKEMQKDLQEIIDSKKGSYLPGWGSWSGPGIVDSKKDFKLSQSVIDETLKKRKDYDLKHLIIYENENNNYKNNSINSIKDLQVDKWNRKRFASKEDQEAFNSLPTGPEWNTARSFIELNRPKIVMARNHAVLPIKQEDYFKQHL